ncbi:MAG TPA: DMT family transporter [Ilumatobacteraceae bacterium]|nr:DMT family transporter [Ilumatobacteraceae bacterium]
MAIVLALLAAFVYGVSDYAGGRTSRRASPFVVSLIAETSVLALLVVLVPAASTSNPERADLAWGAAAGAAGAVGIIALYHALANGAMTVVAPITGVVSAVVPVAVGLAIGERPSVLALVGVSMAIVSVALIGGLIGVPHVRTPVSLAMVALLSGASFGLLFVFFDQAGDDSGLWPLLGARLASGPLLVIAYVATRPHGRIDRRIVLVAILIGVLGMSANFFYLLATRRGLLTIVAVVVAMYPASTVLLATVFDGERMRRPQLIGLAIAALALVMVTIGR